MGHGVRVEGHLEVGIRLILVRAVDTCHNICPRELHLQACLWLIRGNHLSSPKGASLAAAAGFVLVTHPL